ncbi:MAG: hypothetical protein D8M52_02835 [Chlorobi bacterium]|nr:MAG: hypothetical protein F9K28_02120 [Bacteroidota bacterium]KXK33772.1 MAG: hypothetical protein UZ06_CHB003001743 [Chlorobi bacterium OLB6]MBE2266510.1 hypothetical protein [Flavobacteriales bacterium]MBL1160638.1 hypothetical protein [Chlorobiota bacterium]MBW7852988.1 hypothetical protein [Candidatus Kapabacteria bacterium]MCC6330752.1 hypothetical protein [Ignavibacteria bacterium]
MQQFELVLTTGNWWLLVGMALVLAALTVFLYSKTQPVLPRNRKAMLMGLRFCALFTLALALFEPLVSFLYSHTTKPLLVVAVDASRSVPVHTGEQAIHDEIQTLLQKVKGLSNNTRVLLFGSRIRQYNPDSALVFADDRTNMAQVMQYIVNRPRTEQPGVVLMVTDGQWNSGVLPTAVVRDSKVGWYTLGIGDTAVTSDIRLESVTSPEHTRVAQPVLLTATIAADAMNGKTVHVFFEDEGKKIASDTVRITSGKQVSLVKTQWTPVKTGIHRIQVRIISDTADKNQHNNSVIRYVDVKDDKKKVLLLAGAPSPDVSFVKEQLGADKSVILRSFLQKTGGVFYATPPSDTDFRGAVTAVLVGFPEPTTPTDVIQRLVRACEAGLNLFFIPSRTTDYDKLKPLEKFLPFSVVAHRPNEFSVTANVDAASATDPFMRISGDPADQDLWNTLPPIYKTETFVKVNPGADVLATIRVNNIPMQEPLIVRSKNDKQRAVAVLGYGLYRWKLMGTAAAMLHNATAPDVLSTFVSNTMEVLTRDEGEQLLVVKTMHQIYAPGEEISFTGTLLQSVYNLHPKAGVQLTISSAKSSRVVTMQGLGNGTFATRMRPLPPGDYSYKAVAYDADKGIATASGRFSVDTLSIEAAATTQNAALLRGISNASGASYADLKNADSVLARIVADPRMREVAETGSNEVALWNTVWPILVSLSAFSVEWFLRKRYGLM